jgi:hypothetical protein
MFPCMVLYKDVEERDKVTASLSGTALRSDTIESFISLTFFKNYVLIFLG